MIDTNSVKERLISALHPTHIEVIDESAQHYGHAGATPGGNSHFAVTIITPAFAGKNLLERHRMVYEALGDFMQTIHALRIVKAEAP